jgi:hypothetical protein
LPALLGRELGPQDEGPAIELFADDLRAQAVGGELQRGDVVNRKKGIVVLAEADLRAVQLLFDETVAVEVIGGLEREERGHPHHHRTENLIADVEIVVREAAALVGQDAIIWILGRVFRHGDAKVAPCPAQTGRRRAVESRDRPVMRYYSAKVTNIRFSLKQGRFGCKIALNGQTVLTQYQPDYITGETDHAYQYNYVLRQRDRIGARLRWWRC